MIFHGRTISRGIASGEALVGAEALSFLGGVDPKTGTVTEKSNPLYGKSVAGKVLVIPRGKGSTVGTYALYQLKKNGVAPAAIINLESEIILAVGAIISGIPVVDRLDRDPTENIRTGMNVKVDADKGTVEIA
jgi:predicted aconitase with swiveling domain